MFADLAHFFIASVQISCTFIAYPCLLLAYVGQAAWLMQHQDMLGTTFYSSTPTPVYWPMFVVATAAAIIASQAMISAVFSIVDQSMVLGCFPRCKIIHTSSKYHGQIYIPEMNWILMVLCLVITVAIGDPRKISHAYVVAVMFITTLFVTLIMLMIWQKNLLITLAFLTCHPCSTNYRGFHSHSWRCSGCSASAPISASPASPASASSTPTSRRACRGSSRTSSTTSPPCTPPSSSSASSTSPCRESRSKNASCSAALAPLPTACTAAPSATATKTAMAMTTRSSSNCSYVASRSSSTPKLQNLALRIGPKS